MEDKIKLYYLLHKYEHLEVKKHTYMCDLYTIKHKTFLRKIYELNKWKAVPYLYTILFSKINFSPVDI